jgi:hypothetical protein
MPWTYSCADCGNHWVIEEQRDTKCLRCEGQGVLMGADDALASSEADLPVPNMSALIADHMANLAASSPRFGRKARRR